MKILNIFCQSGVAVTDYLQILIKKSVRYSKKIEKIDCKYQNALPSL